MRTVKRDPSPLAYSVNEFCTSVGVGRTKFYELVRDGQIRTVTLGNRRLIPATEINRLLGNEEQLSN
jgi:excisionase family DNA binding protein